MKKQILIIDDEEKIRAIYKKLFYVFGSNIFDVIEASNATEATNYLIRYRVDMIILDIRMPHVDGQILFDVIREYNPCMKVVVASVYPVEQQKRMVPFATAYFDKSQGPVKLLEKVRRVLVYA